MPTRIKILFAHLLNPLGEHIPKGELIVEGGRVREISPRAMEPFEGRVIDWSDCLILPGFVNAHCHLSLSALHGRVPRCGRFTDWARVLVEQNAAIGWEERVRALRRGADAMTRSGVTTLGDFLSQPELLTDYKTLPFRQVAFLETLGFQGSAAGAVVDRVRPVLESHLTGGEKFRLGLAPHAPYSVSPDLFRALQRLAERYNCPVSSHVAEFAEEVRFLKYGGGEMQGFLESRGVYDAGWTPPGAGPVQYLDRLGVLDSLTAVHLNHAEDDPGLLAERGAKAVFCPASTRWFGRTRWMPVRRLLDRGVAVGLGTDSLASNESLDFLNELRMAESMLADVGREEILHMATRGGAEALGFDTGILAPGRPADLIAFRVEAPPASWIDVSFEPGRDRVDFCMVDGKVVLAAGNEKDPPDGEF